MPEDKTERLPSGEPCTPAEALAHARTSSDKLFQEWVKLDATLTQQRRLGDQALHLLESMARVLEGLRPLVATSPDMEIMVDVSLALARSWRAYTPEERLAQLELRDRIVATARAVGEGRLDRRCLLLLFRGLNLPKQDNQP